MKNEEMKLRSHAVQDAIELIGGRWRGAILSSLCGGSKRFSELKGDLSPVTARMLIKELRYLEENLMVVAEKNTAAHNSVVYSLSDHGRSLKFVIFSIYDWSVLHRKMVLKKMTGEILCPAGQGL